jgi:hypothetical protein
MSADVDGARPSRTLVLCFDGTGNLYDSTVRSVFHHHPFCGFVFTMTG